MNENVHAKLISLFKKGHKIGEILALLTTKLSSSKICKVGTDSSPVVSLISL